MGHARNIPGELVSSMCVFIVSLFASAAFLKLLAFLYRVCGVAMTKVCAATAIAGMAALTVHLVVAGGLRAVWPLFTILVFFQVAISMFFVRNWYVFNKLGDLLSYGANLVSDIIATRGAALMAVFAHVIVFILFRFLPEVAYSFTAEPRLNLNVAHIALVDAFPTCTDIDGRQIACCQGSLASERFAFDIRWVAFFCAYWLSSVVTLVLQASIGRVVEEHIASPDEARVVGRELMWRAALHVIKHRLSDLCLAGLLWGAAMRCLGSLERYILHMGAKEHVDFADFINAFPSVGILVALAVWVAWSVLSIAAAMLGMSESVTHRTNPPATTL